MVSRRSPCGPEAYTTGAAALYNPMWRSLTLNPISRRELIRKGGAAAATTFTIVAPQTVRAYQANSKISVGLIGCGGRGTYDATIFHGDKRAQVTALCDLFPDRVESATQALKLTKPDTY